MAGLVDDSFGAAAGGSGHFPDEGLIAQDGI